MDNLNLEAILGMAHSKIGNYILPGLESALLGAKTRLFINTRESIGQITPHNHRFDFQCLVLRGWVVNTLFVKDDAGEEFARKRKIYTGIPGEYKDAHLSGPAMFRLDKHKYQAGDWYGMKSDQFHTIEFSPDAVVLFIEGETVASSFDYLSPIVNGEVIDTMSVEPWMFKKIPD